MSEHGEGAGAVLLIAFEGWNDAGGAATTAIDVLAAEWDAQHLTSLEGEDYYDLQINRPMIARDEDENRIVAWPGTEVYEGFLPSGRPVVLMHSIEPSMRWRAFVAELLDVASGLDVKEVYCLGALLADTPHSRPLPTSVSSSSEQVRRAHNLSESDYEGPTGIVGILEAAAAASGLETYSMWVSVPHYVSDMPCPKGAKALVGRVAEFLGEDITIPELEEDAQRWEQAVTELAEENPEVAGYVAQLESNRDAEESPAATGDAIAAEFERYLRRNGE